MLAGSVVLARCGPLESEAWKLGARAGDCAGSATPISRVQGASSESPLAGDTVEVQGVVTLPLPGVGFYLQSQLPDADPLTSEALFVSAERARVSRGDGVSLRGQVVERQGSTELHALERIQSCARLEPQPAEADLDVSAGLERWEHMWVSSRDSWTLVDTRNSAQGELTVSRTGRLYALGHELGAAVGEAPEELWRLRLSPAPAPGAPCVPRLGSRAETLTTIVQPAASGPALLVERAPSWLESSAPPPVAPGPGVLRVASMNVHNYFAELGGRGASSELELERQRAKLVAALSALDADILALLELGSSLESLEHLSAGLNQARAPAARYVSSSVPAPGASPIRAALLYRADRVDAASEAWFELAPAFTRPPLFQRFRRAGGELTVGVVHLKSKLCDGEPPADELEGCGASVRAAEAAELARVSSSLEREGAERLLLVGDFNADARETPLLALERAGWVDLLRAVPAADRYSFVFQGRATLLDHALANATLVRQSEAASIWHINADEPDSRGYPLDNPPEHYAPDARRSSDHDPVTVDLRL
jgi:uncharacterized protein